MSETNFFDFVDVINSGNFLVLDTETTGLERPAEVCQIGLINSYGEVLFNGLLKPSRGIPSAASAVHGITEDMVRNSPTWPEVKDRVLGFITGQNLIVYNATYDRKMFHSSDDNFGLPKTDYAKLSAWHCAMEWYAEHYGQVHPTYGSYMWQKLRNACAQQGLDIGDEHDAIGDCRMTLALVTHCALRAKSDRLRD